MSIGEFWGVVAAIAAVVTVLYGFIRNSMRDLRTDLIGAIDEKFMAMNAKINA